MLHVTLYSDGGGEKASSAAGACVIEGIRDIPIKLGVFLGEATNNEGEISAALLGFSFLKNLQAKNSELISVHWVADSEYMLKSATGYIKNWLRNGWKTATKQPVKNQGLWQAYLYLSQGLKISTEHVRGHTGHLQNESCDNASTWIRKNGEETFRSGQVSANVFIPKNPLDPNWQIVDGRKFLRNLRCDLPNEQDIELLMNFLSSGGLDYLVTPPTDTNQKVSTKMLTTKLEEALKESKKLQKSKPDFEQISKEIEEIIKKIEN